MIGRPKTIYANPCEHGVPLTDDLSGTPIACALGSTEEGTLCPNNHKCTSVAGSTQSVCCPHNETSNQNLDRKGKILQFNFGLVLYCGYFILDSTADEITEEKIPTSN